MKTLLIVEDELSQQKALFLKLTAEGYRVLTAVSVNDAWVLIGHEHPDLVILDIMLPGGENGFDLLEKLKKDPQCAAIPVLVLTNLDTEEIVTKKIGAADYLVKANTSMEELVRRVKAILPS